MGKKKIYSKNLFFQNNHDFMDALPDEPFRCTSDENN